MVFDVYSLSLIFSFIFMLAILDLVKRNRLHEKYSLLWLLFSIVMIVLSGFPEILKYVAYILNVKYAPSLLFLVGFVFLILYSLSLTVIISKQADRIIKLTQEVAILKENVKKDK